MGINQVKNNRFISNIIRDKFLFIAVAIIVFFWIAIYLLLFFEPNYESKAKVLVADTSTPTFVTNLDGDNNHLTKTNDVLTQLEIIRSYKISTFLFNYLKKHHPDVIKDNDNPQKFFTKTRKHLKTSNKLATDVINISFSWKNPEESQEILREILKEYQKISLDLNKEVHTQKRVYIDKLVKEGETDLKRIRDTIANYQEKNNTIDITEESRRIVNQKVNFKTRLAMLKASIRRNQKTIQKIESELGLDTRTAIKAVALGADNKNLAKLREQLDTANQKLNYESIKLAPTNPKIVALKKQIATIKEQIQKQIKLSIGKHTSDNNVNIYDPVRTKLVLDLVEAQSEYASLIAEKSSLEGSIAKIDALQSTIPGKKFTLETLEQEEKNMAIAYDELRKKQIEAKIKEAEVASSIIIIDQPSLPLKPSFPTILQILGMGFVLSLLIGVIASILKTLVEDVCEGVQEIEATTDQRIIGILPWYAEGQLPEDKAKIDEIAYEKILSNILIKTYSTNSKILTFSSNSIKKYNSTIVYKLASKLKKLGNNVVVIDTDLRNPTLLKDANLEESYKTEFSTLILSIEQKLRKGEKVTDEFILSSLSNDAQELAILSNLSPIDNSYDYFASNAFDIILETLRKYFDWILIDTPTVTIAPEVFVIAKKSDTFVLITTLKITYSILKKVTEDLRSANINFIGCIIRDKSVNVNKYLEFLKK